MNEGKSLKAQCDELWRPARPCETCGRDMRGFEAEYHTSRNHNRQPTYNELLAEVRELNREKA